MTLPCLSCQKSSSSPHNFLLNCISCANSWHHRCHSPPVSDKELIGIIKAFNAAKHNPAAKLIWKCGICINSVNPQLIAVKKPAPQKAIVIDDDIGVSTNRHLSNPQYSSTTQDRLSNAASVQPPRIIDDPFLAHQPSKPQVVSEFIDLTISGDEGDGSDDALEYLTPAPTSKQAPPDPLLRDAHPTAQTSTRITTQLPNHLLTRWLNDRSTTAGVKPDIWARAYLRRNQDAVNRTSLESESAQPPSISPPSRRKYKAHNLNERSLTHSRVTVFLSAETWLREKQTSLLLE